VVVAGAHRSGRGVTRRSSHGSEPFHTTDANTRSADATNADTGSADTAGTNACSSTADPCVTTNSYATDTANASARPATADANITADADISAPHTCRPEIVQPFVGRHTKKVIELAATRRRKAIAARTCSTGAAKPA